MQPQEPHPVSGKILPVEWHDCFWRPVIGVAGAMGAAFGTPLGVLRLRSRLNSIKPLPLPTFLPHPVRRKNLVKLMKRNATAPRHSRTGFTLVELLTVIAIIAILAALLLPALAYAKLAAQKAKARTEIADLQNAIQSYYSAYNRFPIAPWAQNLGSNSFTCGGYYTNNNLATPVWPNSPLPSNYAPSNSDVIAILMDFTNYPDSTYGVATVNWGYQKNPQQRVFLNAKMSGWAPDKGGQAAPGVGNDLVYRDPWGNPYIITMDLNEDDSCQDPFYCLTAVSGAGANSNPGLNGLSNPDGTGGNFRYHGNVMVWSMGPYGPANSAQSSFDPTAAANSSANRSHILSWQ